MADGDHLNKAAAHEVTVRQPIDGITDVPGEGGKVDGFITVQEALQQLASKSGSSGVAAATYSGTAWTTPSGAHPWIWVVDADDPAPEPSDGLAANDVVVYTDPSDEARRIAALTGRDITLLWTPPLIESVSMDALNAQIAMTSGLLVLNYFTAPVADFVASRFTAAQGNIAGASITFAGFGLYLVEDDGDLALVARSANNTALFGSASTNPRAAFTTTGGFPATYTLDLGQRYAVGLLVTGTTMPNLRSQNNPGAAVLGEGGIYRSAAALAAQTDLPASIAVGSLATSGLRPWMAVEAA